MTAATPPASAPSAPPSSSDPSRDADAGRASHFIRQAVDADLARLSAELSTSAALDPSLKEELGRLMAEREKLRRG